MTTPGDHSTASFAHPRSRVLGIAAFAIILLVATIAMPMFAGASTYKSGLNVDVGQSDTLTGNVYIVAPEMHFDATAPQDVYIATVSGNVHGSVSGSLNLLAGRTSVHARVGGSVHVAAGNVTIHSDVGGDLIVAGGNVTVASGATISGDLVITGGTVDLEGTITGSVYGSALNVRLNGEVQGDMHVQASRLAVEDDARIRGDLRYQSPVDANIENETGISGVIDRTNASPWAGVGDGALRPFGSLLKLTWSLLAGAALVAIAPRLASRVAHHARPFLQPAGIGVVSLILIPVIAMLLIGTIIGIPIGLILLVLLPIVLYMSQVFVGITIGGMILPRSWKDGSRGALLLAMTIGVILVAGVRMLPVPFLGPIVTAIVTFWGVGSVVLLLTDLTSRRLRESRMTG